MFARLRARRSAITFDLGGAGTRAYQFTYRGGAPQLTDALSFERGRAPSGDKEAGAAKSSGPPAAAGIEPGQLSRLIGQGRFSGDSVALVLSPPDVRFFPLRLPDQALAQSPDRIEQALKWEVAQDSRSTAEDLEVRYWPLPRARGQQPNVLAVVMPTEAAVKWCELLQRERLNLRRIDVSPCALVRLARCLWTPAETDLWGVLDLGLRHSTLTLVVGPTPTYIRSVSVSAHQWTQQLATAFEVEYNVAEQLKREHGVQPTDRGVGTRAEGRSLLQSADLAAAVSSVLRESLQALGREVGRCFSYVMQGFPDHTVKRLFLAGGGGNLRGLSAVLEASLGITVMPLAAMASSTGDGEHNSLRVEVQPHAAAALGGAILDLEAS